MSPLAQALETDAPPVELLALLVAAELVPKVDVELELRRLDSLFEESGIEEASGKPPDEAAAFLVDRIGRRLGFRGDRDDYHAPENSLLPAVIDRRLGLPISLAVLYVAFARRAGIEAAGCPFPGHFLVRVGGDDDAVFIDPFDARPIGPADLETLLARVHGRPVPVLPEYLLPASERSIATRMLTNLDVAYRKRGLLGMAFVACDRRAEITGLPEHLRERGLLALKLGSDSIAVSDLHDYLERRPAARDRASVRAAAQLASKRLMGAGPRN